MIVRIISRGMNNSGLVSARKTERKRERGGGGRTSVKYLDCTGFQLGTVLSLNFSLALLAVHTQSLLHDDTLTIDVRKKDRHDYLYKTILAAHCICRVETRALPSRIRILLCTDPE